MSDKELLEAAARAAGVNLEWRHMGGGRYAFAVIGSPSWHEWNPLLDYGQALWLAVELHMTVRCYMGNTCAQIGVPGQRNAYEEETNHEDPAAAACRAIVRAAASLAKEQS